MNIHIPNISATKIGGGYSFINNFMSSLTEDKMVDDVKDADVVLISSATMITRDMMSSYDKKLVVLRVDGIPEDWRNRGTGWSRLKEFSQRADLVIYQSEFSKDTTGRLLNKDGLVIYNGVDTSVFCKEGERLVEFGRPSVLYCNYRKGEHNKRVEEVIERFRMMRLEFPRATMTFVGDFSKEQFFWNGIDWDFGMLDLIQGIDWQYMGIIANRQRLAVVMRSCMYIAFPSFADPCPNTLIEAMCCGCDPLWINEYGGQKEIVDRFFDFDWSKERMTNEYLYSFKSLL